MFIPEEREKIERIVAEGNALFEASSEEERKKIIAADVLDQIDLMYKPTMMTYVNNPYNTLGALILERTRCEVCALGAALVSMARKLNHVDLGAPTFELMDGIHWKLTLVFSPKELVQIESAFEMSDMGYVFNIEFSEDELDVLQEEAVYWGFDIVDNTQRLAAIFWNIYNNGTFDLSQPAVPDALEQWKALNQEEI